MEKENKIIIEDEGNGTIEEVLIAPLGQFTGSDKDGQPVEQNFTDESLENLAQNLNSTDNEILCDKDHASAREGLDRDTQALGWFSKFVFKPLQGLFARLRLTKTGREMIENREYRHLSPVFKLNENGEPIELVSVAATNTPAIQTKENIILNNKPNEEIEMTKEEIIELVKTTLAECLVEKEKNEEKEDKKEEIAEKTEEGEVVEAVKETETVKDDCGTVKDECGDNKKTVASEKTCACEDVKEEGEVKEEEKVKKEVITEEALNQSPTTQPNIEPDWKNLSGDNFFNWVKKHPELCYGKK